jgi:AraC-like DNA-binding protein
MLICASQAFDRLIGPGAARVQKIVLTSDELPARLDDRERFLLWRDLYTERFGRLDLSRPDGRRFSIRFEFTRFGSVGLGQFTGTFNRLTRGSRDIAADARHDLCLVVNRGRSPMSSFHRDQEATLAPEAATTYSDCDFADLRGAAENAVLFLPIPRNQLLESVANAEDLTGAALDPSSPALRHLRRYLDIILEPDGIGDDPALAEHIGTTLVDLVALALGTARDGAQIARMRGLRAARLQEVLSAIKAGFAEPAFTVHCVALKLGLSPRYIQDLMQQSGQSFTERVLELRLQKSRAMLAERRHDRMKVIEIAYACGFDGISHFNHSFRRRFGASPTQYRGGNGEGRLAAP